MDQQPRHLDMAATRLLLYLMRQELVAERGQDRRARYRRALIGEKVIGYREFHFARHPRHVTIVFRSALSSIVASHGELTDP